MARPGRLYVGSHVCGLPPLRLSPTADTNLVRAVVREIETPVGGPPVNSREVGPPGTSSRLGDPDANDRRVVPLDCSPTTDHGATVGGSVGLRWCRDRDSGRNEQRCEKRNHLIPHYSSFLVSRE
mgnify:FL=1